MSYLGIDFGLKRIGVAISYYGKSTEVVGVFSPNEFKKNISELVNKHGVEKIIMGEVTNKLATKAKLFAKDLEQLTGIKILITDETLSSQEALKILISAQASKKKRRTKLDAFAACLILENYFENLE